MEVTGRVVRSVEEIGKAPWLEIEVDDPAYPSAKQIFRIPQKSIGDFLLDLNTIVDIEVKPCQPLSR